MPEMMTTDVRAIMDRTPFDVAAVADLRELLNRDPSRYRTLREAVQNIKEREKKEKEGKPETHLRLGVGEVLAGPLPVRPRALEKGRRARDGLLFPRNRPGESAAVRSGRSVVRRRRPSTATTPRIPSCTAPVRFAARAKTMKPGRSSRGWPSRANRRRNTTSSKAACSRRPAR